MKKLSRRAVLTSVGGAAIALPFMPSFRDESRYDVLSLPGARADGTAPTRVVFWIGRYGVTPDLWSPLQTGADQRLKTLNRLMQPLESFKDKMTVLDGVNMPSILPDNGLNTTHSIGSANLLSAAGNSNTFPWGPNAPFVMGRGASIDQVLAKHMGASSKFSYLYAGDTSEHLDSLVVDTNNQAVSPTIWPADLFDRVFDGGNNEDAASREKTRVARKSVLDAVLPAYQHLSSRLSQADKVTIDSHLDSVRELELRLSHGAAACVAPERPMTSRWDGQQVVYDDTKGPYAELIKIFGYALTCNTTRVGVYDFSGTKASARAWIPDIDQICPHDSNGDVHSYSHAHWGETQRLEVWNRIQLYRTNLLAGFLQQLESAEDVDGRSVLDNTVVLHMSEQFTGLHDGLPKQSWGYSQLDPCCSAPPEMRPKGLPVFYVGGAGGKLKTGLHLDLSNGSRYGDSFGKYSHAELYLTIARALGVDAQTMPKFGTPTFCNDLVSEILV